MPLAVPWVVDPENGEVHQLWNTDLHQVGSCLEKGLEVLALCCLWVKFSVCLSP